MRDKLAQAREKLASQILDDFKGKITGNTIDFVIGENPENMFFVGKLLSNKDDNNKTGYSSDVLYVTTPTLEDPVSPTVLGLIV